MPKAKELSEEEKIEILAYKTAGWSNRRIAKHIGRSESAVRYFLKDPNGDTPKKQRGRKTKLSERDVRHIVQTASKSGISSSEIRKELNLPVHSSTIRRVLASEENLQYVKRKSSPELKIHHIEARLKFAEEKVFWKSEWDNIIFSDEKKFNLDGPDGCQYYWHDLRKDSEYFTKRVGGGQSVMIWGGISAKGKTELAFLTGRQDTSKYILTLEKYLLPFGNQIHSGNYIFQQDNASIHVSTQAKTWFASMNLDILEWPAKSPDLNPIENAWGHLTRQVYKHGKQYQRTEDLKIAIKRAWEEMPQEYINSLIFSMSKRCLMVIKNRGKVIDM